MSTKTTNYNFVKPELKDVADITAQNPNWDTLDTTLKGLSDNYTAVSQNLSNTDQNLATVQQALPNLQSKVKYGTSAPSGGQSGDVYIQIIE